MGTVIAFLSVAGLLELGRYVLEFIYMPSQDRITLIVSSKGHDEKIEYLLRSLLFKAHGFHLKILPIIIVVDEGMDEETKAICEKLSGEYGCINICASQELPVLLCPEDNLVH
jgi:cellulose synthase/poly-beta-1,6-N-acetylglucosamine synthase-like glycosyltransferase